MPHGPRRKAVEKTDIEIQVAEQALNMAIENSNWIDAKQANDHLRAARLSRQVALDCYVLDIPGAIDFYAPESRLKEGVKDG